MDKRIVEGREVVALPVPRDYPPCNSCVFSREFDRDRDHSHVNKARKYSNECPNSRELATSGYSACPNIVFVEPIDALTYRLTGIYPLYT